MSSGFRVKHKLDHLDEGEEMELVLADSSITDENEELLINPHLEALNRAKTNQKIKQIANTKGINHSYDDSESKTLLSKYDDPSIKEEGFFLDQSGNFKPPSHEESKIQGTTSLDVKKSVAKEYQDFKPPKKRARAMDFLEGSRTERQEKYMEARKQMKLSSIIGEDEDEDLHKSLQKSLNKANRINATRIETPITQEGEEYTDTSQFLSSVQPIQPRNLNLTLKDARDGTVSVSNITLPTERIKGNSSSTIQTSNPEIYDKAKEENKTAEPVIKEEPKIDRGLAGCLALLRERGELNKKFYFGRSKDKVSEEEEDRAYRDDKGRLLTKKQAFRNQCYAFHNQKPGKNKQKKLNEKEKIQMKQEKLDPSKGSATFMAAKSIMTKKETPYVIISKN
ncbi:unnamed protein product [Blepharisma stoltei]|uniref:Uncharacterized protein n=1 Tax=Blepharisma stoltei TaxID=1481888 RepID=A0AAU9JQB3_9CILI|nr:unnamed protein product [Blepharisma stoltei]